MKNLHIEYEWFAQLVPEGIPVPSSILLSGPGGSGKPLIGLAVVVSWLKRGGKVVLLPLQFPDRSLTGTYMQKLYNVNAADHAGSIFFIAFDADRRPVVEDIEHTSPDSIRANVANPEVWDRTLAIAVESLGPSNQGTLIFGSALNLLLFSATYGHAMLGHLETMLRHAVSETYFFSLSSNVLSDRIAKLEAAADHLLIAEMSKPERDLHLEVRRLKNARFRDEPMVVPFDRELLAEMKKLADEARKKNLPAIKRI